VGFEIAIKTRRVSASLETVWQSYGPPWVNVSNTPFRLYKHFTHEGGIAAPFVVHWPAVLRQRGAVSAQLARVTDIIATFVDIAGTKHPGTFDSHAVQPLEGQSLRPIFEGKTSEHPNPIFWEREGNRAVRLGQWKLLARRGRDWELHDPEADRTELTNVAANHPEKVQEMFALYSAWAQRCNVLQPEELPCARPIRPVDRSDQ